MNNLEFSRHCDDTIERCMGVLNVKAAEYATEDRLHNFKVAAELQGITTKQALAGMMAKHTVCVYDMCRSCKEFPSELWEEKIGDSINYLLLLGALIREEENGCSYQECA